MNILISFNNKKFSLNNILLNFSLLATVFTLFIGGISMKLIALLVTFFYNVVSNKNFYRIHKNNTIIFLILPIFLGLIFPWQHEFKDILRDIFFFGIPYVYYLTGVTLKLNNINYRRLIYVFSGIYCLLFISYSTYYYIINGFISIQIIRDFVSPGSFLLPICIVFLYNEFNVTLLLNPLFIFTQLIFLIQSSRTYFIIIFIFFFDKLFNFKKYTIFLIIVITSLSIFFFRTELQEYDVFNKIFLELSFRDAWTEADMGTSYRAYEAITAYQNFLDYPFIKMIFGGGFGALVNLDMPVVLAGAEYDAVPWIHNGFTFILVKIGVLGFFSYIMFFFKLIKNSFFLENFFYKKILKLTIIGMLLANIVICGLFSTEFAFAYILLGYFSSNNF